MYVLTALARYRQKVIPWRRGAPSQLHHSAALEALGQGFYKVATARIQRA
ncbi:hypothetical protein EIO_1617 [Ketogulonicigenium vulgare Y25]|uniref:Uncharacterized protein n=1 Tax=Ketogulonicigenium vulgare (strain WSH-001) TaxID=759362 RepID=F9Y6I2_KETVW|nr:hypothetical protein EIO_1617 [Ketogulonicigenium vulgare Y25]AEM40928.1 hypothetical protein KVU_1089 [Ketogulonicigenium vulgare WSH-001]ALJ81082.1 hypothetical protein KVH_07775 [Ketogulonicigenium vulgare]ANW35039.1 hypothetical protein KvSKV_07740 [Ketogulonicigenium vulgare]AOZ54653.1 hypothetical protein KVC_1639 [Ketogulonicigenium vulgare]